MSTIITHAGVSKGPIRKAPKYVELPKIASSGGMSPPPNPTPSHEKDMKGRKECLTSPNQDRDIV